MHIWSAFYSALLVLTIMPTSDNSNMYATHPDYPKNADSFLSCQMYKLYQNKKNPKFTRCDAEQIELIARDKFPDKIQQLRNLKSQRKEQIQNIQQAAINIQASIYNNQPQPNNQIPHIEIVFPDDCLITPNNVFRPGNNIEATSCFSIQKIEIINSGKTLAEFSSSIPFNSMIKACTYLLVASFYLSGFGYSYFHQVSSKICPTIRTIEFYDCEFYLDSSEHFRIDKCKKLTNVRFINCKFQSGMQNVLQMAQHSTAVLLEFITVDKKGENISINTIPEKSIFYNYNSKPNTK